MKSSPLAKITGSANYAIAIIAFIAPSKTRGFGTLRINQWQDSFAGKNLGLSKIPVLAGMYGAVQSGKMKVV